MNTSTEAKTVLFLQAQTELLHKFALLFAIFLAGCVIQFMISLFKIGLPYTVVVFALGMLTSVAFAASRTIIIGPHLMLNIFMPILIFEGAFAMDVYVLRKVFWQALFMAGPGLVIITALTAVIAQPLMKNDDWGWMESLMFGAILSATDPVAVVALLKELGASPFLSLFIEGESLMNDGTAMVAFTVIYNVITGNKELNAYNILVEGFLRFAVGAPVFGYFTARCCLFWLSKTFNDPLCEIAATLTTAFLTFFIAEHTLHVSGVLALVTLGVCLSNNRTAISPEVEIFLHSFWEALAYMANTLIFFLVGMIVMDLMLQKAQVWDFVYNFLIYCSINSIRALTVVVFSPLLNRIGYKHPWQFMIVSVWSGLRGAVGLALALMVYETDEEKIPKNTVSYHVFFHLCGIVFLTLVINATTVSRILELLGMSDVSDARRAAMATALSYVIESKQKTMNVWRTDRFLADVDWRLVDDLCTLQEPWDLTQDYDEEKATRIWATCQQCSELVPYQPTKKEMAEMTNEAILRLLKAEKLSYWRQFEHGILSTYAVRMLKELCDNAADGKGKYMDTEAIKNTWKPTAHMKMVAWMKLATDTPKAAFSNTVVPITGGMLSAESSLTETEGCCKKYPRTPRELLTNQLFVMMTAALLYVVLDGTLNVALLILVANNEVNDQITHDSLRYVSYTFLFLMVLYSLVRVVVLKKNYLKSPWFALSVAIFLCGMVEIAFFAEYHIDKHFHVDITMAVLRFIRQLHGLEACIPLIVLFLEHQEVMRLSEGYNMGRGYVMGEEEIRSRIDHMADRREIIEQLRTHCDAAKMDILKALGLLQKDNPEVAMGVKTRQAIRSVLNNLRDEVHTLLQDGLLEEAEGKEIAGMIESKMKKLLTAPPKVPLPSTEKILRNIPWIQDNEELVQFIKERARLMNYEYDTVIMYQDEPTTFVSIILSGLVKLEVTIPRVSEDDKGPKKYTTQILDFLTTGNVLGEIGVLTGKPRTATGKCETAVQVLELDIFDVWLAFKQFSNLEPPLKARLWRLSAIRICTGIFLKQPVFYGLTKDKLRVRLENGFVEEITETPTVYTIGANTGEIVLLHGEAYDEFTQDRYVGPCYIPQNVVYLNFETKQDPCPALFILLSENPQMICRSSLSMGTDGFTSEEINWTSARLKNLHTAMGTTIEQDEELPPKQPHAGEKHGSQIMGFKDLGSDRRISSLTETTKFRRNTRIFKLGAIKSQSITFPRPTVKATTTVLPLVESSPKTSISLMDHHPKMNFEEPHHSNDVSIKSFSDSVSVQQDSRRVSRQDESDLKKSVPARKITAGSLSTPATPKVGSRRVNTSKNVMSPRKISGLYQARTRRSSTEYQQSASYFSEIDQAESTAGVLSLAKVSPSLEDLVMTQDTTPTRRSSQSGGFKESTSTKGTTNNSSERSDSRIILQKNENYSISEPLRSGDDQAKQPPQQPEKERKQKGGDPSTHPKNSDAPSLTRHPKDSAQEVSNLLAPLEASETPVPQKVSKTPQTDLKTREPHKEPNTDVFKKDLRPLAPQTDSKMPVPQEDLETPQPQMYPQAPKDDKDGDSDSDPQISQSMKHTQPQHTQHDRRSSSRISSGGSDCMRNNRRRQKTAKDMSDFSCQTDK